MKLRLLSLLLWQWGSVQGSECTEESCHQHLEDEVSLVQLKMDARKAAEDSAKPKITVVINTPTEPPMPMPMMPPMPVMPAAMSPPAAYKTCKTDAFVCPAAMNKKDDYDNLLCDNEQCSSDLCCKQKECECEHGRAKTEGDCKILDMLGDQCKDCDDGYHLDGAACEVNTCKCDHGIAATGTECTTDQGNICIGCSESGYTLDEYKKDCQATCVCADGTAATGDNCPNPGSIQCSKCDVGFKLDNKKACQAIPKTCKSEAFTCPSDKNPKEDYDYLLCGSSCNTDRCCQDRVCSYFTTQATCPSSNPTCSWDSGTSVCEAGSSNDVSCVVSDWGNWGTCISSTHIRTRSIVTYPKNNGNACPEISEEGSCGSIGETTNNAGASAIGQST